MKRLSSKQMKLLKTINKCEEYPYDESLSNELFFLNDEKLIDFHSHMNDAFTWELDSVYITEPGKSYLSEVQTDRFRFTVPNIVNTILSIIAIIISLIALLK